ncbi:MAG: glycosyltransferase [Gammaproteobacteria bacterium]|nr:glycosyltransferase [Gammaproteobacteria bacterium]
MRVLHVYRTYFPETHGGLEETIRQICLNTAAHGVESRVFCPSRNVQPRVVQRDEAAVHRCRQTGEIASCTLSVEAFPMFKRLLRWADVVHYHFPWPLADMLHFASRVRVPTVTTYHADIARQRVLGWVYTPLMMRFLGSVDRIVCTSPNYLATSKVLRRFEGDVDVVPIGLDENAYPKVTESLLARTKARYGTGFFLFIGVLRYYKCLHILLEAMQGAPYRALIVGAGGLERQLKRQCKRLGLNNVTFTGYVPEPTKIALLAHCRAVVSPSYLRAEAFGVALLEGAMAGKPLISTEVGSGTSHVNVNGETGLVVEPASPPALRAAMDTLHHATELAHTLGAGARRRFERLFDGGLMGERYAGIYHSLTTGASDGTRLPDRAAREPRSATAPQAPRSASS